MKFKPLTDCHVSEIRLSLTSCCLFQDEVVAVAERQQIEDEKTARIIHTEVSRRPVPLGHFLRYCRSVSASVICSINRNIRNSHNDRSVKKYYTHVCNRTGLKTHAATVEAKCEIA